MAPVTRYLSRLIGLFSILASLSLITHKHATVETMTALVHNSPLLLTFGMVFLTAGLAIVLGHNVWPGGALPVVGTVVGWLLLIRGLILLFLSPEAAVGIFAGLHFEHLFFSTCISPSPSPLVSILPIVDSARDRVRILASK